MDSSFYSEIELELRRPIIEHPNIRLEWGVVQNNGSDKDTKPFSIYRFSDLVRKLKTFDDYYDKMYCLCRWFRHWCAKCDENCFCWKGKAIQNPDAFSKDWDIKFNGVKNIDDIEFDVKSTRMPDVFDDDERKYYLNHIEELIKWFYDKQSRGVRYGIQNRFFLVHMSKDRMSENLLRVDFDKKRKMIDEYFDSIESGKHTPYKLNVDGVDVVSDILFIY